MALDKEQLLYLAREYPKDFADYCYANCGYRPTVRQPLHYQYTVHEFCAKYLIHEREINGFCLGNICKYIERIDLVGIDIGAVLLRNKTLDNIYSYALVMRQTKRE
ncbi:MAG: hypothetical protein FWF56_03600 [Firmicutes bacterium]|nr:hypothetical protein [Bacillota bacterium]